MLLCVLYLVLNDVPSLSDTFRPFDLVVEQSLFHVGLDDAVYPCPQHVGGDSGSKLNDEDQTQEDGEGHGHTVRFLQDIQHRLAHKHNLYLAVGNYWDHI